jgi:O-antigen ligase
VSATVLPADRSLSSSAHRVEFWLLVAFAFVLPLFEAPKNIIWGLYVITWVVNRVRSRDFGGPWDGWDTLILAWMASGWLAAAFAGLHAQEWHGPLDLMRYASVLWLVRRSRFSAREIEWILGAVLVSTLLALAWGYWQVWRAPLAKPKTLELRSVGHVNHSAIYLAIVAGAAVTGVLAYWARLSTAGRVLAVLIAGALALSVVATASRGAILGLGVVFFVAGLAWWPRSKWPALVLAGTLVVVTVGAVALRVEVVRKQEQYAEWGVTVLSMRDKVWNSALVAVERFPWFGVGIDNYNQISMERIEEWRKAAGKTFVRDDYAGTSHAHSLYLNTLTERGVVGFAALLAVLVAWLVSLARNYPGRAGTPTDWMVWGAATSAWLVSCGVGLFNTTLHHEHALLSMLCLGLWLAWRGRPAHGNRA